MRVYDGIDGYPERKRATRLSNHADEWISRASWAT